MRALVEIGALTMSWCKLVPHGVRWYPTGYELQNKTPNNRLYSCEARRGTVRGLNRVVALGEVLDEHAVPYRGEHLAAPRQE